jgi:BirA family biotin operon repressor/biotin-[acetyl-CoA-carboxylase] ligase
VADARYEGRDAAALAALLAVPSVEVHNRIGSTNDRAHQLADAGAEAMTVVLADTQSAGRGRHGRTWASAAGAGVWVSVVLRPSDARTTQVLALRTGMALADALEPLRGSALSLKWPNDLFAGDGKLAGILIEARWQDERPLWVVVGIGVNVVPPPGVGAAGLPGAARLDVLAATVAAVRAAAAGRGPLTEEERAAWARRDLARGRVIRSPAEGTVVGIDPHGGLQVQHGETIATFHAGSLLFA